MAFPLSTGAVPPSPAGATAEVCAAAKELVGLLGVRSYGEMGATASSASPDEQQRRGARIDEVAARLEAALLATGAAGGFPAGTVAQPAHAVAMSFARAYRLSSLYPDTVGDADAVIGSLPLPALRRIRAARGGGESAVAAAAERDAAVFRRLAARLGLTPADVAEVEAEQLVAKEKLRHRRQLVARLRAWLPSSTPGSHDAHAFFGRFFPDHPLLPGEVEIAATESCLYFCIWSNDAFSRTDTFLGRDEAARKHALDYLERLRRFNFYNFSHFPAFTSFDAREMDPARLAELAAAMDIEGWASADLVALLNTVVFVEERDQLDKFLVHDSWGHYWQADLTQLGALYARMAALQTPLSPGDAASLGEDGRLGTFLDLVYLRRDGTLVFDETLARRFAAAWIFERFQPRLAPAIAELAADMIEYRPDDGAAGEDGRVRLPSSSRFAHHPAKIDFAWADLLFFNRSLKRVNDVYRQDPAWRAGFLEGARRLFRLKYRCHYDAIAAASPGALDAELAPIFERLLVIFDEVEVEHLGDGLDFSVNADGQVKVNLFFGALLNLLRICVVLNKMVHGQLETRPELAANYRTLVIFIVKLFERDPLKHFWSLDETLQTHAVPLLETLAACEREVT